MGDRGTGLASARSPMDHNLELTKILRAGVRLQIKGTGTGFSVWVDGARVGDVETIEEAIELLQVLAARSPPR